MRDWVTNVERHLLPARLCSWPSPISPHGSRVPVCHRPGGAATDTGDGRWAAAGCRPWPVSEVAATHSGCSTASSMTTGVRLDRRGGRRRSVGAWVGMPRSFATGSSRGSAGHAQLRPSGSSTATSSSPTRFQPVSTMQPWDRNTRGSGTSVGQNTRACLTMRRWPHSRPCADSREFSRRSNHRTRWLMPEPWPATWGATASSS